MGSRAAGPIPNNPMSVPPIQPPACQAHSEVGTLHADFSIRYWHKADIDACALHMSANDPKRTSPSSYDKLILH